MEEGVFSILSILFLVVISMCSIMSQVTLAEPRDKIVQLTCTIQAMQNASLYTTNFVLTMEKIPPQIETQGYGLASTGTGPDAVYGLVQCYGDLSSSDCVLCYSEARSFLTQCYPSVGAKMFLDGCFMRCGNYSFFQEYAGLEDRAVCGNETRKSSEFQETARRAVLQAASSAPNNNGYARAEMPVSKTRKESSYVLANCLRTLNASSCRACLENASTSILGCLPWSEGRALNTGCFIRYSDTNFLNSLPSSGRSKAAPTVVIAVVASSTIVVAMAAAIGAYIWNHSRIEKKRKGSNDVKKMAKILRHSSMNFKYSTLKKATRSFDEANKLGQGGFGTVYKGILPDGREIAVKRLSLNNLHRAANVYNEVKVISRIEHKNLVKLLGCSCGPESLLVYEFMPNRSLDHFLFDPNESTTLNWEKRFLIIIGSAEGLAYLHENTTLRIIHRDVKASNILLDPQLRAKIADFGLARSFQADKSHISTAIAGTLGYIAPEYFAHGKLTEKADVYSFGVLVLEIVTGIQNNRSTTSHYTESLVTTAWKHFQRGKTEDLIDPNLILNDHPKTSVREEVSRVVHVALLCTQEIPLLRPSMSKVLQMLTKKDEHLPSPTKPPFIDEDTMELCCTVKNSLLPSITSNFDSVANVSESIFYPR